MLSGIVRSSTTCTPIPKAQIEFWQVGPNGQYDDEHRATLFTDVSGIYVFESNFPPPYSGRPPHIHIRVTADGHQPLVTQYYPAEDQTKGVFDLVLISTSTSMEDNNDLAVTSAGEQMTVLPPTLFDIPWADRSVFQAGLIDTEQAILDQLGGASVYHLDLEIADDLTHLQGHEEVLYTNQENEVLDEIYFRLFPNLAGGNTTISRLTVNTQPVEPVYELRDSAMRVPLSPAVQPGEPVIIQMAFTVDVPAGEGGNYGTFSFAGGVLALAHFYPMIAVYDDEGWNVEIAPAIGDVVYADTSFYVVRVGAPAAQTLVTSGIEISRDESGGQQTVMFAAGPMRDFYLATSASYKVVSRTLGQTTINSYALDGPEMILDPAEHALQSFNERFGPYPFKEFDVVSTSTSALGVEYPGIVAIVNDLYDQNANVRGSSTRILLEAVVAHEVAHQWFYSLVGNDQIDEPWVDEAMAQFLTLIYYSDVYGSGRAADFRGSLERRWARVDRADIPIGLPVKAYSPGEYSAIVYGRGPLFIEELAETLGPETFETFLRDYYQTHQWGIATGDSFKQLAEQRCNCDLTSLFETWVYDSAGNR
jgi:hypothetical protein